MKTYRVWLQIEECDEDEDEYTDVGECHLIGDFPTMGEAKGYAETILEVAEV